MTKTTPIIMPKIKIWTGPVYIEGMGNKTAYLGTTSRDNIAKIFAEFGIRVTSSVANQLWKENHNVNIKRLLERRAQQPYILKDGANPESLLSFDPLPIPLAVPAGPFRPFWTMEISLVNQLEAIETATLPEGWGIHLKAEPRAIWRHVNGFLPEKDAVALLESAVEAVKTTGLTILSYSLDRKVMHTIL